MKVLLIEDNREISKNIKRYLELDAWTVDIAFDGQTGLDMGLTENYDIILLDGMLPVLDGFEVCKKIHNEKDTPIIMITARDEVSNRITGLEGGADDYLVKPFDLKELETRMFAVLRRSKKEAFKEIIYENIVINLQKRSVLKDGEIVHIPLKEFLILEYLITNEGAAVSRGDIIEYVWGGESLFESDKLDVYISNLRKKLSPDIIQTIKGYGYIFSLSKI
ncbi:MAG: response regulator transcription factor [Candidatus Gracilibacteria bacterium]|nr:response regulator transcription factor [Candidatus Gracilibacteria bacterium]